LLIDRRRPVVSTPPRLKINGLIRAKEVRLISAAGEQDGVVLLRDALIKATEAGLDLVEVAPTANPPVCRIMDFGKYRYEQSKKDHTSKTHQKTVHLKEVQFRPFIGGHDIDFKIRHAKEFLEDKQKVKITLMFRGREMGFQAKGREMMQQIEQQLTEFGHVENALKMEGRNMSIVIAPKSVKDKK
jgi:translation initiation factor IF-3